MTKCGVGFYHLTGIGIPGFRNFILQSLADNISGKPFAKARYQIAGTGSYLTQKCSSFYYILQLVEHGNHLGHCCRCLSDREYSLDSFKMLPFKLLQNSYTIS